jgi:hypothetical protein
MHGAQSEAIHVSSSHPDLHGVYRVWIAYGYLSIIDVCSEREAGQI